MKDRSQTTTTQPTLATQAQGHGEAMGACLRLSMASVDAFWTCALAGPQSSAVHVAQEIAQCLSEHGPKAHQREQQCGARHEHLRERPYAASVRQPGKHGRQ